MRSRALGVALVLFFTAPSLARAAMPEGGLELPVPADAVAYAVVDSVEALSRLLPPASPKSFSETLPPVVFSPEVDARRPLAVTWLGSGARLLHLPVRDAAAFARARGASPADGWTRMIPGAGYVVLLSDDAPGPETLAHDPMMAAPALSGVVRGFVGVDALRARAGNATTGLPDDFMSGVRRVEFAVRLDGTSTEVELGVAPAGTDGVIAALARAQVPAAPNRFLAAMPAGSQVVTSWRVTPDIAAAYERLFATMVSRVEGKGTALPARFERQAKHWSALSRGDSAMAVSGIGSEGVSVVQAGVCRDREKMRRLLRWTMRHGGDRRAGVRVAELRRRVATVDGVEVDEQHLRFELPKGTSPHPVPPAFTSFMSAPVRYAYPPQAVISVMGAGGLPAVRDAVSRLATGEIDPAIDAIDPHAVMAVVVDIRAIAKGAGGVDLPPDMPARASLVLAPRDGLATLRLRAPSMLLQFLPMLMSNAAARGRT